MRDEEWGNVLIIKSYHIEKNARLSQTLDAVHDGVQKIINFEVFFVLENNIDAGHIQHQILCLVRITVVDCVEHCLQLCVQILCVHLCVCSTHFLRTSSV